MSYRRVIAGSTSQLIEFPVYDPNSTTGALLPGVSYNSSGLACYYSRTGVTGSAVAVSLVSMTKGTWVSGGFVAVDGLTMPGIYQLGLPDAVFAAGANSVIVGLGGPAGMVAVVFVIELTTVADYPANLTQINGDATAAANAALQFNGTGLSGATFPSRQDQLNNLVSTGAATNQIMSSWTSLSTPTGTTETGGVANMVARDAVYDVLTNASQAADSYYECNIGGKGVPTSVSIFAAVQNGTKTVNVYGYNWLTTAFVQIGTMTGTNPLTPAQYTFNLFTSMVGSGANSGKVRIRFLASAASTTISIDQMFVSFATVNNSVGYLDGAIWVDTVNGTAGTTLYVNGTADNPTNTWANALTLATALNVKRFRILSGSSITLSGNSTNYEMISNGKWTLALGGQNINGAYFEAADVSGIGTATTDAIFETCDFVGNATLPRGEYRHCGFGTFTFTLTAFIYIFDDCYYSDVSLTAYPIFVQVAGTNVAYRAWHGAIQLNGVVATTNVIVDGIGRININASCTGGSITVRGFFGSVVGYAAYAALGTFTQNARFGTDQVLPANLTQVEGVANNPALAQLGVNVVSEANIDFTALQKTSLNAATPASVQNIVAQTVDAATIPGLTDTTLSASHGAGPWDTSSAVNVTSINGSTTAATKLGLSADTMATGTIDTGSLSPTNALFEASDITDAATNYWVNRWVVFTSGALIGQAKPITGYQLVAGKGRFTTDAFTSAPSNTDTFIIV